MKIILLYLPVWLKSINLMKTIIKQKNTHKKTY